MKLTFTKESGIQIERNLDCTALDRSVFTTATPGCESGTELDGSPYIIISNLIPRRSVYYVGVSNIKNPPAAYEDVTVKCQTCLDSRCFDIID
jgi:hypothetical protein